MGENPPITSYTSLTDIMNAGTSAGEDGADDSEYRSLRRRRLRAVLAPILVTFCDLLVAGLGMGVIPGTHFPESVGDYARLRSSTMDIAVPAVLRALLLLYALLLSRSPRGASACVKFPDALKADGTRKSQQEIDEESLEEHWGPWARRTVARPNMALSAIAAVSGTYTMVKLLLRLAYEIGTGSDNTPGWWIVAALSGIVFPTLELVLTGKACNAFVEMRKDGMRFCGNGRVTDQNLAMMENGLGEPLLRLGESYDVPLSDGNGTGNITASSRSPSMMSLAESEMAVSDIKADPEYHAGWGDLLNLCVPDVYYIIAAFVFLLAAAVAQICIPYFTGNILDSLVEESGREGEVWDVPGFKNNIIWLIVAAIAGGIFSGIRGSIFTVVGGRVNARLRTRLMESLLRQDIGFFDVTKTGDISSRMCSDTTLVGDQVTLNVNVFLRSAVQTVGVLIFMSTISWELTILSFVSSPIITVMCRWYSSFIRRLTNLTQKKLADANSVSEEAFGSMSTVRAFGAEGAQMGRYLKSIDVYLDLNRRSAVAYLFYAFSYSTFPQLVTALVLLYGGKLVQSTGEDHITNGELVSFILYLNSLSDSINSMAYIFGSLTQAIGAADKVFELMYRKPRLRSPSDRDGAEPATNSDTVPCLKTKSGIVPTDCLGEIELSGVDLFYPARPKRKVLDQISLSIQPGTVVALVGQSGGGKSSVISLLQHLYEPSAGSVRIDGTEVHEICPLWLYRNVSVVSQEPTLFARSIKDNIIFGMEGGADEPTMDQVVEAAQLANASSFIEGLPQGYDTEVGERGVQLSGGQKQRIAIARALVRRPKILLLDEATSALDAESEALVQEAIDTMLDRGSRSDRRSMTVVVVAHRLSTVQNADVIYVIKAGKVVEQGQHKHLITNQDGPYYNLVSRQMNAEKKLANKPIA